MPPDQDPMIDNKNFIGPVRPHRERPGESRLLRVRLRDRGLAAIPHRRHGQSRLLECGHYRFESAGGNQ
ncbi:hypothetical protein BOO86_23885 [Mycobacterium sp. CBMA 234]|nr:hypothetical protein [Mycolicibacterium sp. CBMA 234]